MLLNDGMMKNNDKVKQLTGNMHYCVLYAHKQYRVRVNTTSALSASN